MVFLPPVPCEAGFQLASWSGSLVVLICATLKLLGRSGLNRAMTLPESAPSRSFTSCGGPGMGLGPGVVPAPVE